MSRTPGSRPPRRRAGRSMESRRVPVAPERYDLGVRGDLGADYDETPVRPRGLRRVGRLLGWAGGGVAVLGALAIGVFPTQTFLDQRSDTAEASQRLAVLRAQNESFEDRIERLGTDEEIERLAREQYNLAFPGEEAYAVLPAPLPPLELPTLWPFGPMLEPSAEAPAPAVP